MGENHQRPETREAGTGIVLGATRRQTESGQALLELAVVLPVLLAILFSIIEFGFVLGRYQVVVNASREGARTASLFRANCEGDGPIVTETNAAVDRFDGEFGMTLGAPEIVGLVGANGSPSGGLCTAERFRVTVSFDHPITLLSFVLPQSTIPLTSTTTMLNERRP